MYRAVASLASRARGASGIGRQTGSSRHAWIRSYVSKDTTYGVAARGLMLGGFEELADTMKVIMLPEGDHVVWKRCPPEVTKDGVTAATRNLFTQIEAAAFSARRVVDKTNCLAGDCNTRTAVLLRAMHAEGSKSRAAVMNAVDLIRGITMAVDSVVTNLKNKARMISTSEEIAQFATISANGEREIGELIAKAMEKVGMDGAIAVQDGKTLYNELEVVKGVKLDGGYISKYFITNQENWKCELEDPLILTYEKKISSTSALKMLELALKRERPLLIVAEDVESDALATLILNKLLVGVKVCVIKAPGFGEDRKASLHDLAVLTGSKVVTKDLGMSMEKVEFDDLGTCKKVTVSIDDTVIVGGAGNKKEIEERCEQMRSAIDANKSDYDKEKMQERLTKLSGEVAILKIGGASEAEVSEKRDRVNGALNATKAAVEEGIVPGGGVSLLYSSRELDKLQTANFDQKIGVQIIQNALKIPAYNIASHAGVDGDVVVGKLWEQDNPDLGYDAAKVEYVDMVKSGIIDPVKVTRSALVDAARHYTTEITMRFERQSSMLL